MSIHIIKMPDIGEGIAEVELVHWHVQPGDQVAEDQLLADIMTDKATVEVPSPIVGTVQSLGGEVGDTLAVGAELIRIEVDDAHDDGPAALGDDEGARTVHADKTSSAVAAAASNTAASFVATSTTHSTSAPALAASPAVRERARRQGIDLQSVSGSGPDGRVVHADLDDALAGSGPGRYQPRNGEKTIPIRGLRRKIAQKMQESKRHIPHFSYVEEIDVTDIESLRLELNTRWSERHAHLTLLPFLARAIVLAAGEYPQINATFDDEQEQVIQHNAVHIGVATQTESGLMVPVLRHAEARDLWSLATEVGRLAQAARDGTAQANELSGSTISITSLGRLGGIASTPIINRPEVAIVGVNRIARRPVFQGDALVARSMMNLSSSFDHRVVDGLHAAQFIQRLRALLECPAMLFID